MATRAAENLSTVAPAIGLVVCTAPVHFGFFAAILAPFFALYFLYSVFIMSRKPEQRRVRVRRIAVWLLAFTTVAACHWYWFHESRIEADALAGAVLSYKDRMGSYPKNLAEIGIDEKVFGHPWMLGYTFRDGQPFLIYSATFIIFDAYIFDFESRQWRYNAG